MALFDPIRMGSSQPTGYEIQRSLRFNNNDSAHLSRTLSSEGNKRLWTWSGWLKLGKRPDNQRFIFSQRTSSSNQCNIQYSGDGRFRFESGGGKGNAFTQGFFRDPTAWYHLVVTLDSDNSTANDRIIIYVNGERQDLDISPTISTGDHGINNNNAQVIGREADTNSLAYDGYMAEIHFIDGARKAPSDFAETDSITGEYKPIKYVGTYGSQGWYYNFSDNSNNTASTLGKDYSGNGHNTTPGNITISDGIDGDSFTDTPTNNFCVLNVVNRGDDLQELSNGNLKRGGSSDKCLATFLLENGKYYFEYLAEDSNSNHLPGVTQHDTDMRSRNNSEAAFYAPNGEYKIEGGSQQGGQPTYGNGDIIGVAIDTTLSTPKVWFAKNNSWILSGDPSNGTNGQSLTAGKKYVFNADHGSSSGSTTGTCFFGAHQGGFNYTPPTGFGAASSKNLPEPAVADGSQYVNTVTYTANRTARSITGVGFQPDWVWIKSIDAGQDHAKFDAVRGVHKSLKSNDNFQEQNFSNTLTSFDSDGFSLGNDSNVGNVNYAQVPHVAWNWFAGGSTVTNTDGNISSQVRASTTAGFSIVTYSGNGSNGQTVGHGLGVAPSTIILKCRTANQNWRVWHKSLAADGSKRLILDQTNASEDANFLNDTAPTSSVFTLGNSDEAWNESGDTYVAYCFSEIPGFSAFGKYTGNGGAGSGVDGACIYTGFRPQWIMVKRSSGTENWCIWDNVRSSNRNPNGRILRPDSNTNEGGQITGSSGHAIDFLSQGFRCRTGEQKINSNGSTYVYWAFAKNPFKFARAG